MTLVEDLFTAPEVSDCTALFFVYLILFNVIIIHGVPTCCDARAEMH